MNAVAAAISRREGRFPSAAPVQAHGNARGVPVTLRGLAKSFGPKQVLKAVDLHIPAGQFVAVVGKSGCGKSTLLRLIVGLEQATAGRVLIDAEEGRPSGARIMFQEPRLLPWARVRGNVEVGLDRSLATSERRLKAQDALAEVGLDDRGDEWPAVLSGGQKQRVALARALAGHPRLLALDEPLGALDALTRIGMQRLIESVWQQQGFTAVLVTHDVAEAIALADRILVIDEGRIAADLPIDAPRPRHRGDPALAALEGRILDRLFNDQGSGI
ncbi:ATP-binding cassette domain-containing protein [Chelatococcus reniformis]|uniref:Aliphatic sulfonates import ATP-binding protein SsuB n=1 Tax=Chelatococcus reniformis TaxID=1494448 RepID=A0A916XMV1_9HYPH|nr:ATP-binding cassette domain-containing protein [Chelatococcus reniformis]GGC85417.1 aliphatic sulfonates import ATP-binding protein SsuB [Chelatococcus reniformis]